MTHRWHEIAFTPAVQQVQAAEGSREPYARATEIAGPNDRFTDREAAFISARDGFYLASVSETGWPYVQFRGGPPGFARVLDDIRLGWGDFRGNQQYVTVGNVSGNDRVSLFFMDYPNRKRLKLFGRLAYIPVGDDSALAASLAVPGHKVVVQRSAVVTLVGFDWNCPQHIGQRYSLDELADVMRPVHAELEMLKRENGALRAKFAPPY